MSRWRPGALGLSDRYESKSDIDSIEQLSKKLTGDLRKHIRSLGPYPVLSDKWCNMADSLARIANISDMVRTQLCADLRAKATGLVVADGSLTVS